MKMSGTVLTVIGFFVWGSPLLAQNLPPNPPILVGPSSGVTANGLPIRLTATDPDGNAVTSYEILYGDGTSGSVSATSNGSGYPAVVYHRWSVAGAYSVRARARDSAGAYSSWSVPLELSIAPGSYLTFSSPEWEYLPGFQNGDPSNHLDIVILGDGYGALEQGKLKADAATLMARLISRRPFNDREADINAVVVYALSRESGVSHPSSGRFRKTAFDVYLGSSNYGGMLLPNKAAGGNYDVAVRKAPAADLVFYLSNDSVNSIAYIERGGVGAARPHGFMSHSMLVAIHEFGHDFGGVGDEYGGGTTPWSSSTDTAWPNITRLDPSKYPVKWADLLGWEGVSTQQGGGGSSTAYIHWRPVGDCCMSQMSGNWCAVCRRSVNRKIGGFLGNSPPEAFVKVSGSTEASVPLALSFSGLGTDLDTPVSQLSYSWNFGDGGVAPFQNAAHTFGTPGIYTVTFTVSDGVRSSTGTPILVRAIDPLAPPSTPLAPSGPVSGKTRISYVYSASASDPQGQSIKYTFDWGDGKTTITSTVASGSAGSASHSWRSAGTYSIRVKATDPNGNTTPWSAALPVTIAP